MSKSLEKSIEAGLNRLLKDDKLDPQLLTGAITAAVKFLAVKHKLSLAEYGSGLEDLEKGE